MISHADADALSEVRLIVSESDISSAMLLMRESIEYFITYTKLRFFLKAAFEMHFGVKVCKYCR